MKTAYIFLLVVGLFGVSSCSSQQPATRDTLAATTERDRPSAEERAARQAEQLTSRLLLDEATSERVEAVVLKYARRNEALMQGGGDRRSKFGALRENSDAQDEEMKDILDDDQYTIYLELKREQREQLRARRQRAGGR